MRAGLAAYCAGILVGGFAIEPGRVAQYALVALLFSCVLLCYLAPSDRILRQLLFVVALFLVGVAWHGQWASRALRHELPHADAGLDVVLRGRIVSIPDTDRISTGFVLRVDDGPPLLRGESVRLRDYSGLSVRAGQRWQFDVRLRPPVGTANPGAWDSEAQYIQRGIRALGYTREGPDNRLLADAGLATGSVAALRQFLLERMNRVLTPDSAAWQLLPALLIGYRGQISSDTRELLAATGTSHLFVISGLHIGLIAMLVYTGSGFLFRLLLPLGLTLIPRQHPAVCCAILASALYSLLAGFSLPTQRALVMIVVFMGGGLLGKSLSLAVRFLLAMALVLTLNPLAGMNAGFWLSFTAVAALLFMGTGSTGSGFAELLRTQWRIFVALSLPLIVWMGQVTLIAPLVNLLAIPLMGMVLLPLAFLTLLVILVNESFASLLAVPLQYLLQQTVDVLELVRGSSAVLPDWRLDLSVPDPYWFGLLCMALAVVLLLVPLRATLRWLVPILLLPVLVSGREPIPNEMWIRILDVGQGLAIVMQYADKTLLYDTGAAFSGDYDMGAAVVVPVLRALGIRHLDLLVVSHADNDHSGGAASVLEAVPVTSLMVGQALPEATRAGSQNKRLTWRFCRAGQHWRWQNLDLTILYPDQSYADSNLNSCVLRVQLGEASVLFSGDINRDVEYQLARQWRQNLASTVLIAPHHGSKDASSYPLLKTVNPAWVVFSSGAYNRFSHPARQIQQRYRQQGSQLLSTASGGMISLRLRGNSESVAVSCYRQAQPRYWRRSQIQPACRYN